MAYYDDYAIQWSECEFDIYWGETAKIEIS